MDVGKIPVYCQMTSHGIGARGGGGWTLVMKIDGHKVKCDDDIRETQFNVFKFLKQKSC